MLRASAISAKNLARSHSRSFAAAPGKKTGFIGLGNMGGHMANNLLKKGHNVVVFDTAATAIDRVLNHAKTNGFPASAADSPRAVAQQCDTIITMLPNGKIVSKVYEDEIFGVVKSGSLLVDSSTIEADVAINLANKASGLSLSMVDAPVSGGVGGAEAGTLTFMVGGSQADFEKAKVVLECMGKNIVHCGDKGTGQTAKAVNNLILGVSMCAVAEGMNLGVKMGMNPQVLAGIINSSTGRCWSSDTYNPVPGVIATAPSSRGYTGGFAVDLMKKDLGIAIESAKARGVPLELVRQAAAYYDTISKGGNGNMDFSFIYKFLADNKPN